MAHFVAAKAAAGAQLSQGRWNRDGGFLSLHQNLSGATCQLLVAWQFTAFTVRLRAVTLAFKLCPYPKIYYFFQGLGEVLEVL